MATIANKRRKRRQVIRSCLMRSWICNRPRFWGYEVLLKEMRLTDSKAYHNLFRMNPADYQELLTLVSRRTLPTNIRASGRQFQLTSWRSTSATFDKAVHTTHSTATCCLIVRHCCRKLNTFDLFDFVECYKVERSLYIVAVFDSVASTLLLVWTGL